MDQVSLTHSIRCNKGKNASGLGVLAVGVGLKINMQLAWKSLQDKLNLLSFYCGVSD